jgi:hypothetical protein
MDYLLNQTGVFLSRQADLPGAIALGRAALEMKTERLGEDHRAVPLALGNLAVDLAELPDAASLAEAEAMIARAVALDRAHRRGAERADLASTYVQQACIAFRRMQPDPAGFAAAERLATVALAQAWHIWADLFGANSAAIAYVWHNTAYLRGVQGRKAAQQAG